MGINFPENSLPHFLVLKMNQNNMNLPSEANLSEPTKKSRQPNWTIVEDKQLCRSWVAIPLDFPNFDIFINGIRRIAICQLTKSG
jgi:hypothetical protein